MVGSLSHLPERRYDGHDEHSSACSPPAARARTPPFCSIAAVRSAKTFGSQAFPTNKQAHSLALFAASLHPNQTYKGILRLFL